MFLSQRLHAASHAALIHFIISLTAAIMVAILVFGIWFPWPYRELAGGRELFWLIVSIDVVCGPLLTLVIYNPAKSRSELARDLGLVALIQLAALGYGLHTLAFARPIALVFEADRFRVLSIADLDETEIAKAPPWVKAWSTSGIKIVGTRRARSNDELFKSVERSMAGIDVGQRPSWWQDFSLSIPDALARAKPIAELAAKYPKQPSLIDEAIARTGQPESSLRWLPLVSHRALDWTALIDAKTAEPIGYVHLDGF